MRKEQIIKRIMVTAISAVMALGMVNTAWAGNVYGEDGSHIKIMTSIGELNSLPTTDFYGEEVALLPAGTMIWVSSEGSTADPNTIFFYLGVCPKDMLIDYDHVTNTSLYAEALYAEDLESFDKKYSAISEYDTGDSAYVAIFEDTEDGSWHRFFYLLDDGSYPAVSAETNAETESGWKRDSTGWWYKNADGSYPKSTWQQIDGKYYCFNEIGYMLANTVTPDGYTVDENGAWIQSIPKQEEQQTQEWTVDENGFYVGPDGEKPGYTYIPGFGYIESSGGVTELPGTDANPDELSGNKIGYMG